MKNDNIRIYYYLLINLIITQIDTQSTITRTCINFVPKSKSECFTFSDPTNYCCHFSTSENKFYDHCEQINPGNYLTHSNYTILEGKNYTIDCGNVYYPNNKQSCGNSTVLTMADCISGTTKENSCCYYNYSGKKGCVKWDYLAKGSVITGEVVLQCISVYIKTGFIILVLFFIVLY